MSSMLNYVSVLGTARRVLSEGQLDLKKSDKPNIAQV